MADHNALSEGTSPTTAESQQTVRDILMDLRVRRIVSNELKQSRTQRGASQAYTRLESLLHYCIDY